MVQRVFRNFKTNSDTGFGSSAANQGDRLVKPDGTFNVVRTGLPLFVRFNPFHNLITMKWWKFNLVVLLCYLGLNLGFTLIYWMIGVDALNGMMATTAGEKFLEAFFFSCQTFSTVGYGRVNPSSLGTNIVASLESLSGVMSFAILTGLLYGRFARPVLRLQRSEQALISPYKDGVALMFRIANARSNPLMECEGELLLSYKENTSGAGQRRFITLELERKKISSLSLSWTIVHPITEESPLFGWTDKEMKELDAEFIFTLKAFDETYAQTVHARISYLHTEVYRGGRFKPMFSRSPNGDSTRLQLDLISEFEVVKLPQV
jgi:inward rectifier potassium channel